MSKSIIRSGTRKRAIARVSLTSGEGKISINGKSLENFSKILQLKIKTPLILAGSVAKKVNLLIRVKGGGDTGQAEAIALGIANVLVEFDKKLEGVFLEYDRKFLVADVRRKEVSKPNRHGKARAKRQKSYR